MTLFEQKIKEMGYDNEALSQKLKQDVKDFYKAVAELGTLKEQLDSLDTDDADYEKVKAEHDSYYEDVVAEDERLTSKIEKYLAKKPFWEEHTKKMRELAAQKKNNAGQAAPAPAIPPVTQSGAASVAQPQPQAIQSQGGLTAVEPVVIPHFFDLLFKKCHFLVVLFC